LIAAFLIEMLAAAAASISVAVANPSFFSRLAKKRGIAARRATALLRAMRPQNPIPQIGNHAGTARSSISSHWPVRQLVFLTQNLHQPAGLIPPSTSVHAFGSWNREQLLHC